MKPELQRFLNAIKIMRAIDMGELLEAGAIEPRDLRAWSAFRTNPYNWLITASDERALAVWSIIEGRQPKS